MVKGFLNYFTTYSHVDMTFLYGGSRMNAIAIWISLHTMRVCVCVYVNNS